MSANTALGAEYLRELTAEAKATRECLANVPLEKFDWKPHERSMGLGYLATLIADMPRWILQMVETRLIDFETWEPFTTRDGGELVAHFDEGMERAGQAISRMTDEDLTAEFILKNGDQIYMSEPVGETISSTINHMVHHRGQLSVYLRLNGKEVPSIYGPSADSAGF